MNDALFRDWIDIVWASHPGGKIKKNNSLLVLDAFRCHKSEDQLKHLKKQHKTDVAIILGSITYILQPQDVSVKLLKSKLHNLWTEWMLTGEKSFTKGFVLLTWLRYTNGPCIYGKNWIHRLLCTVL